MAKRRVNRPLLIALIVSLVVISGGVVVAVYRWLPRDPSPYISRAQELEKGPDTGQADSNWEMDLTKAAENYERAYAYETRRSEKELWGLRAGDVYWALGREDKAMGYYNLVARLAGGSVQAQERLVRLTMYIVSIQGGDRAFQMLIERANGLVLHAPDKPVGYLAEAFGRIQANRPNDRAEALNLLATLRKLDPNEPLGYYLAAVTLIQPARGDSTQPRQDFDAADKLMEFVPDTASPAQASRFHLYRIFYLRQRIPLMLEDLPPEQRPAKVAELEKLIAELLDKVTDISAMSRQEQDRLASFNVDLGRREQAEKIYRGWTNDFASELMTLSDPAVSEPLLARLQNSQPISLAGSLRLAELLLVDRTRASDVTRLIDAGQSVPLPPDPSTMLYNLQRHQQCELAVVRARQLLRQGQTDAEFRAARQFIRKIEEDYDRVVENNATYQLLAGQIADRTGRPYEAQIRLERAVSLMESRPGHSRGDYLEALFTLINVYRRIEQFGRAQELHRDKLSRMGLARTDPAWQVMSAQLAMDVRDFTGADKILDGLLSNADIKDPLARQIKEMKARVLQATGNYEAYVAMMRQIDADSPAQMFREGVLDLHRKNEDSALEKMRQALAAEPGLWQAAVGVCEILVRRDQKTEAVAVLDKFIKDNPNNKQQLIAATVMKKTIMENRETAQAELRRMLEENEPPLRRFLRQAEEFAAQQKMPEARRLLGEAEKLVAAEELNAFLGSAFELLVRFNDLPTAQAYLDRLRKADADSVGGKSFEARLLFAEGNFRESAARSREVLAIRRADSATRRLLAMALDRGNLASPSEIIEELRQSIKDNPLDRDSRRELVRLLLQSNPQRAFREAEEGIARLGNDPYLYSVWLAGQTMENPDKAIAEREKFVQLRPDNPENRLALAVLYYRTKQPEKAEAQLNQIQALITKLPEPARPPWLFNVAIVWNDNGHPDKGRAILEQYLKDNPGQPSAHWAWGDFCRRQGLTEEAENAYLKTLALNPTDRSRYLVLLADFYRETRRLVAAMEQLAKAREVHGATDDLLKLIMLRQAQYQIEFNRLVEAKETLDQLRSLWPNMHEINELEGYRLARAGNWQDAEAAFDLAIRNNPGLASAYHQRGRVRYLSNPSQNLNKAIEDYEQAVRLAPDLLDGQPYLELADLYMRRWAVDQALSTIRKQLARKPSDQLARHRLISIYEIQRNERELNAALAEAMQMFPNSPQFKVDAGRAAMRLKEPARAEQLYREAMKLAPKDEMVAVHLASALAAQEKWQPLLDESEGWIKEIGPSPRLHTTRADAFARLKQDERMLDELSLAVDAARTEPGFMLHMAMMVRNMIGQERAEQWLKQRIERRGDSVPARLMLAFFYSMTDRPAEAIKVCDSMLAGELTLPQQVDIYSNKALIHQQHNQFKEAVACYEKVIELATLERAPREVLNNYAYLLADSLGQAAKAIPFAEQAVRMTNPPRDDPSLLDTLGWCYVKAGQVQRGIDVLNEARNLLVAKRANPMAIIHYHLAAGYNLLNQPESAREEAEAAVRLYGPDNKSPDAAAARELLIRLGGQPDQAGAGGG